MSVCHSSHTMFFYLLLCVHKVVVTTGGPIVLTPLLSSQRSTPLSGHGNEWVFQTSTDADLTSNILSSCSTLGRFPGGTPADYFDWGFGFLDTPTGSGCGGCDALPWRPCRGDALSAYLNASHQRTVLVLNQLNSNASYQVQGLQYFDSVGIKIEFIEMVRDVYFYIFEKGYPQKHSKKVHHTRALPQKRVMKCMIQAGLMW